MHLYITARDFEFTDTIRQYVQKRLVHAVEAHCSAHDRQRLEVQLYRAGDNEPRFGCHVMLQLPSHQEINIREEASDLYESIDGAEKRLLRQLADQRQRRLTAARHPRRLSWNSLGRALGLRA